MNKNLSLAPNQLNYCNFTVMYIILSNRFNINNYLLCAQWFIKRGGERGYLMNKIFVLVKQCELDDLTVLDRTQVTEEGCFTR